MRFAGSIFQHITLSICSSKHRVGHLMNQLSATFKKQYSIPYSNLCLNTRHNSSADRINSVD